eukprot:1152907-Pelagomonas_calceolata.AAC.1
MGSGLVPRQHPNMPRSALAFARHAYQAFAGRPSKVPRQHPNMPRSAPARPGRGLRETSLQV